MNSEDDMHDANDDDFYSGETAGDSDDANDADYHCIGHDSDDSDHIIFYRHQQTYTILSEADICQRQEESIMEISTVLSISRVAASILLHHYN
ncbi:probable E3 ubiquitin-protein ligase ARI8 isoform X2 [Actinidia eriantha]|nr:probable E3 ubiquitin-protein ligase ARI8 isoform X2 [Actinidia eriantha]